ncbi:MAG: HD domain-containing protein [Clostridiaceae bacterium]|nr:HD domain-containing protein [Clostridiaceae bacterium]
MQTLFDEIDKHLLNDDKPSDYFKKLIENDLFKNEYPFTLISRLEKTEQSPKHHPEGNVWNHTLLVLDNAAQVRVKSKDPRAFMWAALLHDLGKATTTKYRKGRLTSYNHDIEGEKLAVSFLEYFNEEKNFITKVSKMVRWHMQILIVTKNLPFSNIEEMKKQVDIEEIALLGLCDRLGRGMEQDVENEIMIMENFINVCSR